MRHREDEELKDQCFSRQTSHRRGIPCSVGRIPCSAKQIRCSVPNRELSAAHWNCGTNGRKSAAESAEMIGNFKSSLFVTLFSGNVRCKADADRLICFEFWKCLTRSNTPHGSG